MSLKNDPKQSNQIQRNNLCRQFRQAMLKIKDLTFLKAEVTIYQSIYYYLGDYTNNSLQQTVTTGPYFNCH